MPISRSVRELCGGETSTPSDVAVDPRQLLTTLITHSPLGVGIWDRHLRFRVVNHALASMNGYSPQAHLRKPLHKMIGTLAESVARAREHVFTTGQLLRDVRHSGLLPTRREMGYWVETSFPLRDKGGKISYVGAIILEVTEVLKLQESVQHIAGALRHANSALNERRLPVLPDLESVLRRSISQLCAISDFLTPALLANIAASLRDPLCQLGVAGLSGEPALPRTDTSVPLSSREQQVLRLLALGKTNKEIAANLSLSARTIETYRARLMLKLGLHSVPQLVRYAIRTHII